MQNYVRKIQKISRISFSEGNFNKNDFHRLFYFSENSENIVWLNGTFEFDIMSKLFGEIFSDKLSTRNYFFCLFALSMLSLFGNRYTNDCVEFKNQVKIICKKIFIYNEFPININLQIIYIFIYLYQNKYYLIYFLFII